MDNPANSSPPSLRASDEDRERTATILRDGYSHGRLDLDELQQRLDLAYAAKTLNQLSRLTKDLPSTTGSTPVPAAPAGQSVPGDPNRARRIRDRILTYVVLMLFLIVIWAASGGGSFWPIWPIAVGALILALDLLGIERRRGLSLGDSRQTRRDRRRDNRRIR
jgi:hypothetical protein